MDKKLLTKYAVFLEDPDNVDYDGTRLTEKEIKEIINKPQSKDVYFVPRKNFFMGKWLKHAWQYPGTDCSMSLIEHVPYTAEQAGAELVFVAVWWIGFFLTRWERVEQ